MEQGRAYSFKRCSIWVCVPSQKRIMGSNTDTIQHPAMLPSPASLVCHGLQPFARIIFPPASATTTSPALPAPLQPPPPVQPLAARLFVRPGRCPCGTAGTAGGRGRCGPARPSRASRRSRGNAGGIQARRPPLTRPVLPPG